MAVRGNAVPRRAAPGSRWVVSGSGNVYELLRKEPPFDYVLRLVELGAEGAKWKAGTIGDVIRVERDWFDIRARRAS